MVSWTLLRLSRDYHHTVRVAINYSGLNANKVLSPETDSVVFANILTSGFNMLYYNISPKSYSVNINIDNFHAKTDDKHLLIELPSEVISNALKTELKSKEEVISIYPQILSVKLNKAYSRKVPVIIDAEISYASQYFLNGKMLYEPDSITISGSNEVVSKVKNIKTEKKQISQLNDNTFMTLKLVNPYNNYILRLSNDYIKLFIPVVQYTENFVEVPVSLDSVVSNHEVITYPDFVKVYYLIGINNFNKVVADSFKVSIHTEELQHSTSNYAKIKLERQPSFVKIQRVEPEKVEYIIRK